MQNQGNALLWVRLLGFVWNFRKHLHIIDRRIVGLTGPGHHVLVESGTARMFE